MNIEKMTSVEIDMKNIHYKLLDEKARYKIVCIL